VYCRLLLAIALAGALLSPPARAEGEQNLRLLWAKSSETDLGTVVIGDYDPSPESNYVLGAEYGYQYSDTLFSLPIQMTANVGVQWLKERGYQEDGYGTTAFVKAYYNWRLPLTQKHVRLGLAEGLSYVTRIPVSEVRDFAEKGAESEKLMNYLEWTIDVPMRQFNALAPLFQGSAIEDVSIGYIVWHRSSVFGVFSKTGGGVNFMGFGIQAHF